MKRRAALAFLVASAASATVWALSPALSGHAEPWDADVVFYLACLVLAGMIAGGLVPHALVFLAAAAISAFVRRRYAARSPAAGSS